METSTLERPDAPEVDEDVIVLEHEPRTDIGTYKPGIRRLGSMAASAAAGDFLRNTATLVAPDDRPDEPPRPSKDTWAGEDMLPHAA